MSVTFKVSSSTNLRPDFFISFVVQEYFKNRLKVHEITRELILKWGCFFSKVQCSSYLSEPVNI